MSLQLMGEGTLFGDHGLRNPDSSKKPFGTYYLDFCRSRHMSGRECRFKITQPKGMRIKQSEQPSIFNNESPPRAIQ